MGTLVAANCVLNLHVLSYHSLTELDLFTLLSLVFMFINALIVLCMKFGITPFFKIPAIPQYSSAVSELDEEALRQFCFKCNCRQVGYVTHCHACRKCASQVYEHTRFYSTCLTADNIRGVLLSLVFMVLQLGVMTTEGVYAFAYRYGVMGWF